MQKFNEPCIKTGEFAKLCNTNKRTLIHYDEIGLFSPAYTDEKGYRYYTESQSDVFFTITCLKDIGMPLKEIKKYIIDKNPADLKNLLKEQEQKVAANLKQLQRIQEVIHTKLSLIQTGEKIHFTDRISAPVTETHPEEILITSPRLDTADHEKLFHALCQHIGYCNHSMLNTGHPYGAMLPVSELQKGNTDIYAYFFTKVAFSSPDIPQLIKPAGTYAAVYLKGNYYDAEQAYRILFNYMTTNHLTPGEFCYKEAVWDELTVEEEEFITRISVQCI